MVNPPKLQERYLSLKIAMARMMLKAVLMKMRQTSSGTIIITSKHCSIKKMTERVHSHEVPWLLPSPLCSMQEHGRTKGNKTVLVSLPVLV